MIAIIGILAALILPTLSKAKNKAKSVQCLSNLKQLQLAWHLYAADHDGKLPMNSDGPDAGQSAYVPSWVAGWLTTGSSPENTDTGLLVGKEFARFGSIGGYSQNAAIYHCPADVSTDKTRGQLRARSVSMNGWVNPGPNGPSSGSPGTAGFEQYRRESDYVKLAPSDAFVFLDERPDSINDGWFRVETTGYNPLNLAELTIRDLPAVYHNGASAFTFADGHSEFHRWRTLQQLVIKNEGGKRKPISTPNDKDVQWIMEHATKPVAQP